MDEGEKMNDQDQEPKKLVCGDLALEVYAEDRVSFPSGFYLLKVAGGNMAVMPCAVANDPRTEFLSDELKRERELRKDAEAKLKTVTQKWNTLQKLLIDEA